MSSTCLRLGRFWLSWMAVVLTGLARDPPETQNASNEVRVVEVSSPEQVEVMRSGAANWDHAYPEQVLHPGDRLRTRQHGRALLRLSDQSFFRVNALTELIVQPPDHPQGL